MKLNYFLSVKLVWFGNTLRFLKMHFHVILLLGLAAALGRTIQLGAFGAVSNTANVLLEIVIESSRILMFLFVLGLANLKSGALRMKYLFTDKIKRRAYSTIAIQSIRSRWSTILVNIFAFLIIAWLINYLIDLLAYETCLYLTLRKEGYIVPAASEWTIILFFKNLSVIPLTITFNALFLVWITKSLTAIRLQKVNNHQNQRGYLK